MIPDQDAALRRERRHRITVQVGLLVVCLGLWTLLFLGLWWLALGLVALGTFALIAWLHRS